MVSGNDPDQQFPYVGGGNGMFGVDLQRKRSTNTVSRDR